jgi:hypothetical protein
VRPFNPAKRQCLMNPQPDSRSAPTTPVLECLQARAIMHVSPTDVAIRESLRHFWTDSSNRPTPLEIHITPVVSSD